MLSDGSLLEKDKHGGEKEEKSGKGQDGDKELNQIQK